VVDIEAWLRFRAEVEMSSARKPEGVREVADVEEAASAAIDRSRRALALSRFSSCGLLVL
jgi:hypothetical protein